MTFFSRAAPVLCVFCAIQVTARAAIIYDTKGDSTYETVYDGSGDGQSLARLVSNYTDPVTGEPNPIFADDGRPLVVGSDALGEDPERSDQSQVQRFFVADEDESFRVRYLGLGRAGYRSLFGAYAYPVDGAIDDAILIPLLTQNISPIGTEVFFDVPAGHYFGFYLDANGHTSSQGVWFTENEFNTDTTEDVVTDHFLVFNTNHGVLLAVEDLPRRGNGRLGDQDYEDLLIGFVTKADGSPIPMPPSGVVPEPASILPLVLAGLQLGSLRLSRGH